MFRSSQVFAAAVVKGAKNPDASKRLIKFLASEKATPTVEKTGMKAAGTAVTVMKKWRRIAESRDLFENLCNELRPKLPVKDE
jgi:hypothetical protein